MILQALYDYYQRKQRNPDPARRLPAFGFEDKEIPFVIELDAEGRLLGLKDTRQLDGKKKVGARFLVPQGVKKTSGVAANLLWDTAEYVIGIDTKGKPERVAQQHAAFRERIAALPAQDDAGIRAVLAFLSRDPVRELESQPGWPELLESNPLMSFRVAPDTELVCQRPGIVDGTENDFGEGLDGAVCLVTGHHEEPERLHSAIKGVWGAQTSGANIVSFNLDAFRSFGKEQGANAPVSPTTAFAYTTALNHLLAKGSRQRVQVGDASTVFWTQQDDSVEDVFALMFGDGDDPDARTEEIRAVYEAVRSGKFGGARGETRFYVLGLAPNAARISIRFWHAAPLSEIAARIAEWFDDLAIARGPNDLEYPSLFRLLAAIAVQNKADNIPPRLGGDIMRAILEGLPFPATWLNAAVQRCRAEQRVTYLRAAALKACLNRLIRQQRQRDSAPSEKEYPTMLDPDNLHPAYRLGRLFAVLEKIQEEASPGLNATIRDRYYGAASSSPATVFPMLLKLKNHHISKLDERGRRMLYRAFQDHKPDDYIGVVLWGPTMGEMPAHLQLVDQGRFALGYYHQRQAFFTKVEPSQATQTNETAQENN